MNFVEYGRKRDERIVELVTRGSAFTRTQIQELIFNQKDAKRKAQERLRVLERSGRLNKFVRSPHEPIIYYTGKPRTRLRNVDHTLLVNEVYTAIMTQKKSYFKVTWHWEYPIMDTIRADAMIDIKDLMTGKRHVIFVEVERYADHRFVKDKSYANIASMNWKHEPWAIREPDRILFPAVLIVTETPLAIKSELDIFVSSIIDVKRDVYSIILRR